jgi:hypothetical protein
MQCPKCGSENPPNAQFCSLCWFQISPEPPAAPPADRPYPGSSIPPGPGPGFYSAPPPPQPWGQGPYRGAPFAPSPFAPPPPASGRAIAAFVFGILSITCCPVFPILAAVLGWGEMKAIQERRSSPSGETFAKVGFWLGVVFGIIQALYWLLYGLGIILSIIGAIAGG